MSSESTTTETMPALCCDCGTVRTIRSTCRLRGVPKQQEHAGENIPERWGDERCIVSRKCAACARVTRHAYLRDDDHRDYCEEHDAELGWISRAPTEQERDVRRLAIETVHQADTLTLLADWTHLWALGDER